MLQGENDEATLEELRNIIVSITNGDIPKPYDLLSMDTEQPETTSKTVTFLKPLAVTVELTPEILHSLKRYAAVPAKMKRPSLY